MISNSRIARLFRIAAALAFAIQISPVVRSQDASTPPPQQSAPPSLGDVARKYREEKAAKDKNQAQAKTTYTNDGLGKGGDPLGGSMPNMASGGRAADAFAGAMQTLDNASQKLDELEALDRATLIHNATGGNTADFPGRRDWEDRLVKEQKYYVSHGRELIQSLKALMTEAKRLGDANPNISDNDPRVTSLMTKIKEKYDDSMKTAADLKALVEEGRSRAAQASGR